MEARERARTTIGASGLRVLSEYGIDGAREVYEGAFEALVVCILAVSGRERACEVFGHIINEYAPRVGRSKPHLVIDNGSDSAA